MHQHRRAIRITTVVAFVALTACTADGRSATTSSSVPSSSSSMPAQTPIAQPTQPTSGPGGSDYAHADWRVSEGGLGNDAWYLFEPIDPQPASAPVAIVMHGYFEFAGYDSEYEFIRHTVRHGTIVIYPRWQTRPRWTSNRASAQPSTVYATLWTTCRQA